VPSPPNDRPGQRPRKIVAGFLAGARDCSCHRLFVLTSKPSSSAGTVPEIEGTTVNRRGVRGNVAARDTYVSPSFWTSALQTPHPGQLADAGQCCKPKTSATQTSWSVSRELRIWMTSVPWAVLPGLEHVWRDSSMATLLIFDRLADDVVVRLCHHHSDYPPPRPVVRTIPLEPTDATGFTVFSNAATTCAYTTRRRRRLSCSNTPPRQESHTRRPVRQQYSSVKSPSRQDITQWRDYLDPLRVSFAASGRPFERTLMLYPSSCLSRPIHHRPGRGWTPGSPPLIVRDPKRHAR